MHFTVLVVGTQFAWEEVDELLFSYWFYPGMISEEEMRADPRFVFASVNLEEAFEEEKLRNPKHKKEYEKYKNAQDWAEHHPFLSYEKNLGWGYWHNPQTKNPKWDWYLIGGRWTGFFLLKQRAEGFLGIPGPFINSPTDPRAADQARKGDIDWSAMRARARLRAEEIWEKAMQSTDPYRIKWGYGLYRTDNKESFIAREGLFAGTPFAVLKHGNWIERVQKAWTSEAPSERSISEWHKKFQSLLEEIQDDEVLTLVDCHI
jgi:hypothetical protein